MVDELKEIYFIGKKFEFVQRKSEKFIYTNEEKSLGKLNILELEFNETEKRVKKIDIYTLKNDELLETINVFRGDDDKVDIYYYPNGTELVNVNSKKVSCNVNMYKNYSQNNGNYYQEVCEIEITKKGHKKHKALTCLPLQENYFISKEKKPYYIGSNKLSEFNKMTKLLMPSLNEIEESLFKCEVPDISDIESNLVTPSNIQIYKNPNYKVNKWLGIKQQERVMEKETEEIKPLSIEDNYPEELYIYDRDYKVIGKKSNAVIYESTSDGIVDIEIYFNDNAIEEFRYIEYKNDEKKRSKKKIIRAVLLEDGSIKTSLVNRSRQNIILSSHELEKATIRADSKVNNEGKIIEDDIIISSKIGKFELTRHPSNKYLFVDSNSEEYSFASSSYVNYKIFITFTPFIMNLLKEKLLVKEEEKNSYEKVKKVL